MLSFVEERMHLTDQSMVILKSAWTLEHTWCFLAEHLCGQSTLLSVRFNIVLSCYKAKIKKTPWNGLFPLIYNVSHCKQIRHIERATTASSMIQMPVPPSSAQQNLLKSFTYCGMLWETDVRTWGKCAHLPFLPTKVARYPCPSESWTFSVISCSWNIDCRPRTVAETSAKQREEKANDSFIFHLKIFSQRMTKTNFTAHSSTHLHI